MRRPELTVKQILAWADAYHERIGRWPDLKSGRVWEPPDEKWINIDQDLAKGFRGLHGGSTLAQLLAKHRGKRNRKALPRYSVSRVLCWADAYHTRTGHWPTHKSGPIADAPGETWVAVDMALRKGRRGMPGGTSLARVLAERRGVVNRLRQPRLSQRKILLWADRHRRRTGNWPTIATTSSVSDAAGESWTKIDRALRSGRRGLRPGSSLFKLLAKHRRVSRHVRRPPLTFATVLAWADEHFSRTGKWPKQDSGRISAATGDESWNRINQALIHGSRGLPGGKSLAVLLAERRGVRTRVALPPLSEKLILRWARAYKLQYGRWPTRHSGTIPRTGSETWSSVRMALRRRKRGLKRRMTLTQLFASRSS